MGVSLCLSVSLFLLVCVVWTSVLVSLSPSLSLCLTLSLFLSASFSLSFSSSSSPLPFSPLCLSSPQVQQCFLPSLSHTPQRRSFSYPGSLLSASEPSGLQGLWALRSRFLTGILQALSPLSPHYCLLTSDYPAPSFEKAVSWPCWGLFSPTVPTALPPGSLLIRTRPQPSSLLPQTNCRNLGAGTRGAPVTFGSRSRRAPVTFGSHPSERQKGLHIQVHPPCQCCTDITARLQNNP